MWSKKPFVEPVHSKLTADQKCAEYEMDDRKSDWTINL